MKILLQYLFLIHRASLLCGTMSDLCMRIYVIGQSWLMLWFTAMLAAVGGPASSDAVRLLHSMDVDIRFMWTVLPTMQRRYGMVSRIDRACLQHSFLYSMAAVEAGVLSYGRGIFLAVYACFFF